MNSESRPYLPSGQSGSADNPPTPFLPSPQQSSSANDAWTRERFAIYASLDAAMTKSVLEAVRSLTELKQTVEEEGRASIAALNSERLGLHREVEDLRLEREILQNQIQQAQQELDQVRAQKLTLEGKEWAASLQVPPVPEMMQQELDNFSGQFQLLSQQVQHFIQQRFNELYARFSNKVESKYLPPDFAANSYQPFAHSGEEADISTNKANNFAGTEILPEEKSPDTASFSTSMADAANLSPKTIPLTAKMLIKMKQAQKVKAPTPTSKSEPHEKEEFIEATSAEELEDFGDTPTHRLEGGSKIINLPGSEKVNIPLEDDAGETKVIEPHKDKQEDQILSQIKDAKAVVSRKRKQAMEQRIDEILGQEAVKDEVNADELVSGKNTDSEISIVDDIAVVTPNSHTKTTSSPGSKLSNAHEKEANRRQLEEIAAKLGLEVMTPPLLSAVRFAPGFKPHSNGGSDYTRRPKKVEHSSNYNFMPPPVLPDETLDTSPAVQIPEITDSTESSDIEFSTASPKIGELGDDFAHEFHNPNSMKPSFSGPGGNTLLQAEDFAALPLPPSNLEEPSAHHADEGDLATKVTISNLQGLSLLTMEKVVRGLHGIHHVTVTDFRKGVLEMDVSHAPDVKLEEVLTTLPTLKLVLVERDLNSLEFLQEK